MNFFYKNIRKWRWFFLTTAVFIIVSSIIYTKRLVDRLAESERKRIELLAEGFKQINNNPDQEIDLFFKIVEQNTTIPVILTDENGKIIDHQNLVLPDKEPEVFLEKKLNQMKSGSNAPIEIDLYKGKKNYVYYSNSIILRQIVRYPYIQLSVIIIFILLGYFALSYAKRAEQNQLWVGLSKETAHQLGTPISSLMAWQEILKEKKFDTPMLKEISKDIVRLKNISERFSKIGSVPVLENKNIIDILEDSITYLKQRFSSKIKYSISAPKKPVTAMLNPDLISWVIENLTKNAVDAMGGKGTISFDIQENEKQVILDVADTGKGILSNKFNTIFKPGYTTKKRGWGLGLSLTKRIVENYHKGKIFVKKSIIGKGTCFRILLNKEN